MRIPAPSITTTDLQAVIRGLPTSPVISSSLARRGSWRVHPEATGCSAAGAVGDKLGSALIGSRLVTEPDAAVLPNGAAVRAVLEMVRFGVSRLECGPGCRRSVERRPCRDLKGTRAGVDGRLGEADDDARRVAPRRAGVHHGRADVGPAIQRWSGADVPGLLQARIQDPAVLSIPRAENRRACRAVPRPALADPGSPAAGSPLRSVGTQAYPRHVRGAGGDPSSVQTRATPTLPSGRAQREHARGRTPLDPCHHSRSGGVRLVRDTCLRVDGKVVAGLGRSSRLAYLPHSGDGSRSSPDQLVGSQITSGSLHFAIDEPLPDDLVRRLVEAS